MTAPQWRQVTITFPDPHTAEQTARTHLAPILTDAEQRLITTWFYVRKGDWRLRYLPTGAGTDRYLTTELERLTRDRHIYAAVPGIYEPEANAFGGPEAMHAAHQLWHHDSRHLITDRALLRPERHHEISIMLVAAMLRAAALDWYEQGDVWARVAAHRDSPNPENVGPLLVAVKRLVTVDTASLTTLKGALTGHEDLLETYASTGDVLRRLNQTGRLHRGLRDVLAHHVIFTWNRRSIPGLQQAAIATAAKTVVFGPDPTLAVTSGDRS